MIDIAERNRRPAGRRVQGAAAMALVFMLLPALALGQQDAGAGVMLQRAIQLEVEDGDLRAAIGLYEEIVAGYPGDRPIVASALMRMASCLEKLGQTDEARQHFGRVATAFGEEPGLGEITAAAREAYVALSPLPEESDLVARKLRDGSHYMAAPSKDGRYLFASDEAGDLIRIELATGELTQITSERPGPRWGGWIWTPVPSPDGRRVAYVWWSEEFDWQLRVINVDGTGMRLLVPDDADPKAWTLDGSGLICRIGNAIVEISATDGAVRRVIVDELDTKGLGGALSVSPDGSYAAVGVRSGAGDIHLLDMETGASEPLVEHPAQEWGPAVWTPDGRRLLFYSTRYGNPDLMAVDLIGGQRVGLPRVVKSNFGTGGLLGISDNGALFYSTGSNFTDLYSVELDAGTLEVAGSPAPVSSSHTGAHSPAVSPDGAYLAFMFRRPEIEEFAIVVQDARTGAVREFPLYRDGTGSEDMQWLGRWPELQWATVAGSAQLLINGSLRAYSVDPVTGRFSPLLEVPGAVDTSSTGTHRESLAVYGFLPDGKTLLYARTYLEAETWQRSIRRRDVQSGDDAEIYRPQDEHSFAQHYTVRISPDGGQLAIAEARDSESEYSFALLLVPTAGGPARELLEGDWFYADNIARPFVWAPDGKALIVAGTNEAAPEQGAGDKTSTFWAVPIDGGPRRGLGSVPLEAANQLSLHPDGTRLVFEAGGFSQEIWVLENLLPSLPER